jgi:hydroxymethylpyrimidine pyrophosphatase-like HAD family hydrolase
MCETLLLFFFFRYTVPMHKMPEPSAIKALALDLDGTALLPDTVMGRRTEQCLKRLVANGMQVIICTGRSIEASYRYYSAIGAQGPMVFFNGAEVAQVPDITVLESRLMALDVADYGIDLARSMDVHFQMFLPPGRGPKRTGSGTMPWEALVIDRMRPEARMYEQHTGVTPVVADMKAALTEPGLEGCVKATFITDPGLHAEIQQKMSARFGSRIYMARTYPTFLEVMDAGASKGNGLKTAMALRGLEPQEVMACGDEENDLPMFAVAGYSAAPSSAKDSVRQAAGYVFGPCAEEGLAIFLEELFG